MPDVTDLSPLVKRVEEAQEAFFKKIEWLKSEGGITVERYHRLLSMQYHLTKGVQRYFIGAASHPSLRRRKRFREFLFNFGIEEETHFELAESDLAALGLQPTPCPIDVLLWKAYFDSILTERPFIRLGATPILENITGKCQAEVRALLAAASFLKKDSTRFIVLHQHETVPHGDEIMEALAGAKPSPEELNDLCFGADIGALTYLRLFDWVITGKN